MGGGRGGGGVGGGEGGRRGRLLKYSGRVIPGQPKVDFRVRVLNDWFIALLIAGRSLAVVVRLWVAVLVSPLGHNVYGMKPRRYTIDFGCGGREDKGRGKRANQRQGFRWSEHAAGNRKNPMLQKKHNQKGLDRIETSERPSPEPNIGAVKISD